MKNCPSSIGLETRQRITIINSIMDEKQQPITHKPMSRTKYKIRNEKGLNQQVKDIFAERGKTTEEIDNYIATKNNRAKRALIKRYNEKRSAEMDSPQQSKTIKGFFNYLEFLVKKNKETGFLAGQKYIHDNVSLQFSTSRAKIKPKKDEAPKFGLPKHQPKGNTIQIKHDAPLICNKSSTIYHICIRNHPLYDIKESTIKGAGMGLFAARNFKTGDMLGLYCGKMADGLKRKPKIYGFAKQIVKKGDAWTIIEPTHEDVFLGMHYINDPLYGIPEAEREHKAATMHDDKDYNVRISNDFLVTAETDIRQGDELFLNYGTSMVGAKDEDIAET